MDELSKPISWLDNLTMYVSVALMLLVLTIYAANRQYQQANEALVKALQENIYYVSPNQYAELTNIKG